MFVSSFSYVLATFFLEDGLVCKIPTRFWCDQIWTIIGKNNKQTVEQRKTISGDSTFFYTGNKNQVA